MSQCHQTCSQSVNRALKSIKKNEKEIIEERTRAAVLLQELTDTLASSETMQEKRLQIKKQVSHENQGNSKRGLSPFEKRLMNY